MYRVETKIIYYQYEEDIFGNYWDNKYVKEYMTDNSLILKKDDSDSVNSLKVINNIASLTEKIIKGNGSGVRVECINYIKID